MARKRPAAARKRRSTTRTDAIVAVSKAAAREATVLRHDSYANAITGLGTSRDKRIGGFVSYSRIDHQEAEDLWRGDDMAAKIIEEPAREMTRRWLDVQIEPGKDEDPAKAKETSEAVEKELMRLAAKKRVREAIMRQRAFGGAVIVLGANDGQEDLTEALTEKKLASIDFLNVFDAFEAYPHSYYSDPEEEKFGQPKTYYVNPASMPGSLAAQQNIVHETRLLRFEGVMVSRRAVAANRGWPDSSLTRVKQVLADFGMGWDGAAHLLQDFSQAVFRMRGLAEASAAGAEGEELIRKRLEDVELGRSLLRAIVLDAGQGNGEPMEEFERKATPIAGLADLLDRFANRLAAAADMPVTRLMGQSPAGLNATGRQDENWWFDRIAGLQEEVILEPLTRLVQLIFLCKEGPTKGRVPENWSIVFRPLQQESAMERADRMGRLANAHASWIASKVLTPEEVAISTFGGDEFSDHIHIDKDRRKEASELRPIVEVSPPDVQALIALWQGQGIAFSEMRDRLRKAGIATLDDEKAKDEMAAENPPMPPGGSGGPGGPEGPLGPEGPGGESLVSPEDLAALEESLLAEEESAPEETPGKPREKEAKADAAPAPDRPVIVPVVVDRHADEAALAAAVAEGLAPVLEQLGRPRALLLNRDESGRVIGGTSRPGEERSDGDLPGHPFRGNQYTEGQGAGASGPGAPEPQLESQAFRAWFGASKAVDAQGKPLRLYHGTGKSFSEFRGEWIYVSADPKFASKFATSPVAIPADPGAFYEAKITERDGTQRTVRGWKSDLPGVFVAEVQNGSYSLTHETSGAALTTGFETPTDALEAATKLAKKLGNTFTTFKTFEEGRTLPEETRAKIAKAVKSVQPKQSDFDGIAEAFSYSGARGRGTGVGEGSQVMPLYASVKKPLDLRELPARNVHPRRVVEALNKAGIDVTMRDFPFANRDLYQMLNDESVQEAVRSKAVAAGYDGIVYKDFFDAKHRGESWVVFHPEQLKSALGNRGTFDPKRRSVVDAADREDGDSPGHPFRGNQHAEAPVDAGGGSGGGAPAASARTPTGAQGAARWATKSTDPATMTPGEINRELDRLERVASEVNHALIAAGRGWEKFNETAQKAKDNPNDTLAQDLVRVNDRQGKLRGEIAARYGPDAPSRLPPGFKARKRDEEHADFDPDQPRDEKGRWAEGGGSLSVRGPDEPAGGGSGKPPPSVEELSERVARSAARAERSRYMLSITFGAKRSLVERDLRWAENELREAREALASAQAARPTERTQSDEPTGPAKAKPPAVRTNARAQACDTCGGLVAPQQGRLHRCMGLSSGCFEHEEEEGGWHVSCLDKGGCEGRVEKRKAAQKAFIESTQARSRAIREILPLFDKGERPALNSWPEGERFPVGGRDEIRIGKDAIWSVIYNGADGDNWAANNAPGAIVRRLPRTPDLEAKIRAIPTVKRDGEVADGFDPEQPRDEKGRWAEGRGASIGGPAEPEGGGGGPGPAAEQAAGAQKPAEQKRASGKRRRRQRRSPWQILKERVEHERYAIEQQFRKHGKSLPWETAETLFARPDGEVVITDPGVHRSGREWVVFRPTEMFRIHGGYYDDYVVTGQRLPRTPQTAALERRVRALAQLPLEELRRWDADADWDPAEHPRGQPGNPGQFVEKGAGEAAAAKPEEQAAALSPEHQAALARARVVNVHALYERARKNAGLTYDVARAAFPAKGFVVSVNPEAELAVREMNEGILRDYLDRHAPMLTGERCLGVWHDTEKRKWYLDVVHVIDDREKAVTLARAHNQEAIYDLEKGETIIVKEAHERRDAAATLGRVFVRLDPKQPVAEMLKILRAIEEAAEEEKDERGEGEDEAREDADEPGVFVVSVNPDAEAVVRTDISEGLLSSYLALHRSSLVGDACLAAWRDARQGRWSLDVVEVVDSREEANARAEEPGRIHDLSLVEGRRFLPLDPTLNPAEMVAAMRAVEHHEDRLPADWDAEKHPRGQPKNAGQFASSPGGAEADDEARDRDRGQAEAKGTREEIAEAIRFYAKDRGGEYHRLPTEKRAELVARYIQEKRAGAGEPKPGGKERGGEAPEKAGEKEKIEKKGAAEKEKAEKEKKASIEAERERWAKRARSDMGKAGKAWARLSLAERDALGDARNTIPLRVKEFLGAREWPEAKDSTSAISARLEQFKDEIPRESRTMIRDLGKSVSASLRECGVKEEQAVAIERQAVDHVIAQEMEAQRRTLGDHGAHHLYGDDRVAREILTQIPGEHDTPQNRLMMGLAAAYHDVGYLAPPAQNFLDKDHPRWGSQYFAEHVEPQVADALGKDFAQSTAQVIFGHDTNRIDWEEEPNVAAFSTADNLALFHKEKLPPLLRYVPENTKTLVALAEKKITVEEAKGKMRAAIEATNLSASVKARFNAAVDEVSGVLPKFTLGMIGTKLEGVEWERDHLRVNVTRFKANEALAKVLDLGQRQFEKLASTYNGSGQELVEKGKLDLKENGKTRLSVVIRGRRGDTWFELVLEDERPDPGGDPTSGRN